MNIAHFMKIAHFIFGVFGNVAALCLFLAPVVTFKRIIQNKSIEQFSGVPYVMALFNNVLSTWYGLPFVSSNNIPVLAISGLGAVIECGYTLVFLIFAPRREKLKIGGLFVLILSIFAVVAFVSLYKYHDHNERKDFCGYAAGASSFIMYAAPFTVMWSVIKTKSVEYMPFSLSACYCLSSICWLIFGLLGRDYFIAAPNMFGSAVGAMQLILYYIYHDKKAGDENNIIAEHSVEMGLNGSA